MAAFGGLRDLLSFTNLEVGRKRKGRLPAWSFAVFALFFSFLFFFFFSLLSFFFFSLARLNSHFPGLLITCVVGTTLQASGF